MIDDIYSGKYKPGDIITQDSITKLFGISRFPVRDALQRIADLGLVKKNPRNMITVNAFSRLFLENLYDTRKILEIAAITKIYKKFTDQDIDDLNNINKQYKIALQTDDIPKAGLLDERFHKNLIRRDYLNNDVLYDLIRTVRKRINHPRGIARLNNSYILQRKKNSFKRHQRIIDAISKGDESEIVNAVSCVIENAKKGIISSLEKNNWLNHG